MKKNSVVILAAVLSVISVFVSIFVLWSVGYCNAKKIPVTEPSNTVTVTGRVVYGQYRNGNISVFWSKDGAMPAVQPLVLKKPGTFSIKIPKETGKIYISANCTIDDPKSAVAFASYPPITVGSNDIALGALYLVEQKSLLGKKIYSGKTVKISGKVIQKNYQKGIINVIAQSAENYKDIRTLSKPGNYFILVPQGTGKIYISAYNAPVDELRKAKRDIPGTLIGEYKGNPLEVGSSNISGVDIIIQ